MWHYTMVTVTVSHSRVASYLGGFELCIFIFLFFAIMCQKKILKCIFESTSLKLRSRVWSVNYKSYAGEKKFSRPTPFHELVSQTCTHLSLPIRTEVMNTSLSSFGNARPPFKQAHGWIIKSMSTFLPGQCRHSYLYPWLKVAQLL